MNLNVGLRPGSRCFATKLNPRNYEHSISPTLLLRKLELTSLQTAQPAGGRSSTPERRFLFWFSPAGLILDYPIAASVAAASLLSSPFAAA